MNDTLEKALATIINNTTNAVGAGISFLSEQIPDVVRQLLLWEATKSGVLGAIWLVFFIGLSVIVIKSTKALLKGNMDGGFIAFFGLLGAGFSLFFCVGYILNLLQILIAPKIFLITYTATLIKGN